MDIYDFYNPETDLAMGAWDPFWTPLMSLW